MTFLVGQNNVKAKVFLAFVRDKKKMEIIGFFTECCHALNPFLETHIATFTAEAKYICQVD